MLASHLDFNYIVTEPPDGMWGVEVSPGQWNGMIGMVMRKVQLNLPIKTTLGTQ